MKKTLSIIIIFLTLLNTNLSAKVAENIKNGYQSLYLSLEVADEKFDGDKVFGVEDIGNVLNTQNSKNTYIGFGYNIKEKEKGMNAQIGAYINFNKDKDDEIGGGIEFKIFAYKLKFLNISPFFGGRVGFSSFSNKGKILYLNSNISAVSYIMSNPMTGKTYQIGNFKATKSEDDFSFNIDYNLGLKMEIFDSLNLVASFQHAGRKYTTSYHINGLIVNNDTALTVGANSLNLGISYMF